MTASASGPPLGDLAAVADAHARLLATLGPMRDDDAAAPSGLPGWNRAQVVTHLARNADSLRHVIEARLRGEVVAQYPGGPSARAAAIEAGRNRSAYELKADLASAVEWLHDTLASVPDDGWELETQPGPGTVRTVAGLVEARWREVEVHHADLEMGYEPLDWPASFGARFLPVTVEHTDDRGRGDPMEGQGPPDATWVVWADDLEMAWVIQTAAGVAVVSALDEEFPDVMVRGPANGLLAWLLGRRAPAEIGLKVSGESRLAMDLPGWFPFP